jgi:hypothetical protein
MGEGFEDDRGCREGRVRLRCGGRQDFGEESRLG